MGGNEQNFSINVGSVVSDEVDAKPIVVLFVYCLVKHFKGMYFLPTNIVSHFLDTERGKKEKIMHAIGILTLTFLRLKITMKG
jgi:hypothetical protein